MIGGAVIPTDEKLPFLEKSKLENIEVDSRPCVIQRSRIMRHRARLEHWSFEFSLQIEEEIIPVDTIHEMLTDAGRRAGIGDFRAAKGGPFGRFQITSWKVQ